MTPAIPAGYRRLRVGEKRPVGYMVRDSKGEYYAGIWFGDRILRNDHELFGPYIAPVARKGGKKGKK